MKPAELERYRSYAREILHTLEENGHLTHEQKQGEIVAYFILVANRIRFEVQE